MEDEIVEIEEQVMEEAVAEVAQLEEERTDLLADVEIISAEVADAAPEPITCDSTIEAYIASISSL